MKGPPQVSTLARSSSESSAGESSNVVKDEDQKQSTEVVTQSEPSPPKKDDNEEEEEEDGSGTAGLAGFLQLLQAMSGGVRVQSSGDDGDGIQGLLARLGIVTRKFDFFVDLTFVYELIFRTKYSKENSQFNTASNWKC